MDDIQLKLALNEALPGLTASAIVDGDLCSQGLPEHANNILFIQVYCFCICNI